MNNDQFTHKCSSLLEHTFVVLKKPQVSNDICSVDHDNGHDSLNIVCNEIFSIGFFTRDHVI